MRDAQVQNGAVSVQLDAVMTTLETRLPQIAADIRRLHARHDAGLDHLERLIIAARRVERTWEQGDLAAAVRHLVVATDEAVAFIERESERA